MANTQTLVDYQQNSMYPNTLIEAIMFDESSGVTGKDALVKSLLGINNPASDSSYYVFGGSGSKEVTSIVNSEAVKALSGVNMSATGFLQVTSTGGISVADASSASMGTADVANKVKSSLKIYTNATTYSTFDGSTDVTIDTVYKAKRAEDASTATHAGDASTALKASYAEHLGASTASHLGAGIVYTDADGVPYNKAYEGSSGDTKVLTVKNTNGTYSLVWDNGNDLGGGVTLGTAESDNDPYYIIGVASNQSGKISNVYKGSNSSPYFKAGNLYQTSDETLKTFTDDLDVDLDNLATIKKGLFYWNNDENKVLDLGVTAQSVEPLFPEIVSEADGIKSVSYSKLSVVALAAIDKLYKRIQDLEEEIKELKKEK